MRPSACVCMCMCVVWNTHVVDAFYLKSRHCIMYHKPFVEQTSFQIWQGMGKRLYQANKLISWIVTECISHAKRNSFKLLFIRLCLLVQCAFLYNNTDIFIWECMQLSNKKSLLHFNWKSQVPIVRPKKSDKAIYPGSA